MNSGEEALAAYVRDHAAEVTVTVSEEAGDKPKASFKCPECDRTISLRNAYPANFICRTCAGCGREWRPASTTSPLIDATELKGQSIKVLAYWHTRAELFRWSSSYLP